MSDYTYPTAETAEQFVPRCPGCNARMNIRGRTCATCQHSHHADLGLVDTSPNEVGGDA